jgi:hypothetical protein
MAGFGRARRGTAGSRTRWYGGLAAGLVVVVVVAPGPVRMLVYVWT